MSKKKSLRKYQQNNCIFNAITNNNCLYSYYYLIILLIATDVSEVSNFIHLSNSRLAKINKLRKIEIY